MTSSAGTSRSTEPSTGRTDRAATALRPVEIITGYNPHAEGSALVNWGRTQVAATVTIEKQLPRHLRGTNSPTGWLTAEYALLPRSTTQRVSRERLYTSGRTQEIQRLISRALRSCVDLSLFRNHTITVDADVIVADGGTRCASILAGYAALHQAAGRLIERGTLSEWPLTHEVAAVSVGMLGSEVRVDLEYSEDAAADIDLNVVATGAGEIIEVQGGTEGVPLPAESYVKLVALGVSAVEELMRVVRPQLG